MRAAQEGRAEVRTVHESRCSRDEHRRCQGPVGEEERLVVVRGLCKLEKHRGRDGASSVSYAGVLSQDGPPAQQQCPW